MGISINHGNEGDPYFFSALVDRTGEFAGARIAVPVFQPPNLEPSCVYLGISINISILLFPFTLSFTLSPGVSVKEVCFYPTVSQ